MMSNLFSVFDPSTNMFNTSMNWLSTMLGLMTIPTSMWTIPSRNSTAWNSTMKKMHEELSTLLETKKTNNGSTLMFTSLFSMILMNNMLGLFPYIFTSTSHLTLTLTMALPLWVSFMMFGWINNTKHMLTHLVPQGTPPILMPFMVCIETISNVIRPGTLAIRLTANMIAGHLLMTLLGENGSSMAYPMISMLIITQIALLTLETAVAIIQSYVFAVLSTLYSSEIN
uniref:ATP synthase subunit a n=1 Tax=Zootermopsis angusticollis TaxID=7503 RepID=I6T8J6_ZOOAN|nr:ATP synthase F0 subunit 6 [Zootermopsis angusticollis]AFM92426.1 ATP synthase F0 subunit 6 [Zootermopsis angusticollis]